MKWSFWSTPRWLSLPHCSRMGVLVIVLGWNILLSFCPILLPEWSLCAHVTVGLCIFLFVLMILLILIISWSALVQLLRPTFGTYTKSNHFSIQCDFISHCLPYISHSLCMKYSVLPSHHGDLLILPDTNQHLFLGNIFSKLKMGNSYI